jgi:hypothetical protein
LKGREVKEYMACWIFAEMRETGDGTELCRRTSWKIFTCIFRGDRRITLKWVFGREAVTGTY